MGAFSDRYLTITVQMRGFVKFHNFPVLWIVPVSLGGLRTEQPKFKQGSVANGDLPGAIAAHNHTDQLLHQSPMTDYPNPIASLVLLPQLAIPSPGPLASHG